MFQQVADDFLNKKMPGLHNQAMMEFGAMLCKPKNPGCGICPVRTGCVAYNTNAVAALPVKLKTVKVRERFFNYFLITSGDTILMNKRGDKDIWANMFDLPMAETDTLLSVKELLKQPGVSAVFGNDIEAIEVSPVHKHILTHQRLFVRLIKIENQPLKMHENWVKINVQNLPELALPKIIFILLKNIFNL
jgi:A/G-specific adenine glycosylase